MSLPSWQMRYRELMLLGKSLPTLPDELKVDEAKVTGCESNVWLYIDFDEQEETLVIAADSDTRIVKGILAIIVHLFAAKTLSEVINTSAEQEFEELGLLHHLSPSRGNGIRAIVEQIHAFARQYSN